MDAERYRSSAAAARENPRSAGFSQERLNRLPMDPAQRPAPSIQERFRNMIRDREQELREAREGGLEMPLLDEQDIVQIYEELLSELVFNSKPTITDLTIIAGELRDSYAKGIADAICSRIDEVPRDQKLPALYLLDSIVKNIGHEYVKYFAARLPKVFCEAYKEVHSSLHAAMRHLFGTWSRVFPAAVLGKIEDELKFASPENLRSDSLANMRGSESPHPSHGIHINPKYLVARQNRATDVQNPREVPFQMQATGEISSIKINERDSDHVDLQPSYTKFREGSPQSVALQRSAGGGQERPFLPSQSKVVMTSSPTRPGVGRSTSPLDQRLQRNSVRTNEVVGSHRASQRDVWFGRSRTTDDGVHQAAALTTYDGYGRQRQRELIDAYGNYRGKDTIHERFPKIPRVDANGIKSETAKMDWQNSEEEEYVWEDMNQSMTEESRRNNVLLQASSSNLGLRPDLGRPDVISQKSDLRPHSWLLPPVKDLITNSDDRIAHQDQIGLRSSNKMHFEDTGRANEHFGQMPSSQYSQTHGSLSHAFHHFSKGSLSPKPVENPSQLPYLGGGAALNMHQKRNSFFDNPHTNGLSLLKQPGVYPEAPNIEASTLDARKAYHPTVAPVIWPPAHKSQPLPLLPSHVNLQVKSQLNYLDANKQVGNQLPNLYSSTPQQQINTNEKKLFSKGSVPYQLSGSVHLNSRSSESNLLISSQDSGSFGPPMLSQTSASLLTQLRSAEEPQRVLIGAQPHGQGLVLPNSTGRATSTVQSISDFSIHGHGPLPPLPPGQPPYSSLPLPASQNNSGTSNSPVTAFSGLISSLMAQGLISLTPAQLENSVGLEFNSELLKVRHESAINAMYADLPRQCTTCGLRFKCQEDHSNHMDWHVTKNRMSKNRKQKPSRKWFVSAKEWLCGAETLGTDVVPGFLPAVTVTENKEDRELAVPADENQTVCALCGEPFEDFYSDETEEWMYKGAVYLNAPSGDIEDLTRSQLGPIVHAKCRPESTEGSS